MPGPDLTLLIARMKELGYDIAPMPSLEQTFVSCETCELKADFFNCPDCLGSGLIPDATLAKWLKEMSDIMDKAYGKS